MSKAELLSRRVEQALRAIVTMHHSGALPPVLQPLLAIAPPTGMEPIVRLHPKLSDANHGATGDGEGAELDGDGDAEMWAAQAGGVSVSYVARESLVESGPRDGDPIPDLIEVVLQAERNPQLHFLALKFLRDRLLPQSGHPWTRSPLTCQRTIADAIESGILHTSKKPNPRNQAYPVTAVALNHNHAKVRRVLRARGLDLPQAADAADAADEAAAAHGVAAD
jgi:hypothetical protein